MIFQDISKMLFCQTKKSNIERGCFEQRYMNKIFKTVRLRSRLADYCKFCAGNTGVGLPVIFGLYG